MLISRGLLLLLQLQDFDLELGYLVGLLVILGLQLLDLGGELVDGGALLLELLDLSLRCGESLAVSRLQRLNLRLNGVVIGFCLKKSGVLNFGGGRSRRGGFVRRCAKSREVRLRCFDFGLESLDLGVQSSDAFGLSGVGSLRRFKLSGSENVRVYGETKMTHLGIDSCKLGGVVGLVGLQLLESAPKRSKLLLGLCLCLLQLLQRGRLRLDLALSRLQGRLQRLDFTLERGNGLNLCVDRVVGLVQLRKWSGMSQRAANTSHTLLCSSARALLSSRTSLIEEMDCAPGVLPFVEAVLGGRPADAVLGGRATELDGAVGLGPDTVRLTPSVTEARGFAVVEDLSADAPASGDATEARGVGLEGGAGLAVVGALVAAVVGAFAPGAAGLVGARDCRRDAVPGTGGGGIALDADSFSVVGLVAAGLVAVAAPVLAVFFRAVVAAPVGAFAGGAAVALVADGVAFTVPDPNVPELMIYAARCPQRW